MPSTRHYSRCGLPLMLQCGHACCYQVKKYNKYIVCLRKIIAKYLQCVVSHRAQCSRSSIISCPLCNVTSNTNLDMIKTNLSSVIHYLQLGLLQWQELEIQLKGENIGFKGIFLLLLVIFMLIVLFFFFQCRREQVVCTEQKPCQSRGYNHTS